MLNKCVENEMYYLFFFIGCVESIIPLESIELGNCGKMTIDFETYKAPNKNTEQNDYDKVQVIITILLIYILSILMLKCKKIDLFKSDS